MCTYLLPVKRLNEGLETIRTQMIGGGVSRQDDEALLMRMNYYYGLRSDWE